MICAKEIKEYRQFFCVPVVAYQWVLTPGMGKASAPWRSPPPPTTNHYRRKVSVFRGIPAQEHFPA